MGCKQSKAADATAVTVATDGLPTVGKETSKTITTSDDLASLSPTRQTTKPSKQSVNTDQNGDRLYRIFVQLSEDPTSHSDSNSQLWSQALELCQNLPNLTKFQNATDRTTSLHVLCSMVHDQPTDLTLQRLSTVTRAMVQTYPEALRVVDSKGAIPLQYAIVPPQPQFHDKKIPSWWRAWADLLQFLIASDLSSAVKFLSRDDVNFDPTVDAKSATGPCTPLYRALQCLPDDFVGTGPTVDYIQVLHDTHPRMVSVGNAADGDKPLSLLYRRFTRQFDISEKFFPGDNSRPEVLEHRHRYKMAAGNTWKLIELLLRPSVSIMSASSSSSDSTSLWRIVHRAVQVETPPDLLRYIVETNAEDLAQVDEFGNLPLHYAAKSVPLPLQQDKTSQKKKTASFPSFYTKYVVDELLYKFPEAAGIPDGQGKFPITLAINSGKQLIGGGIKSLYEAYPEALKQVDLSQHEEIQRALSYVDDDDGPNESSPMQHANGEDSAILLVRDDHNDAIMLVQQEYVECDEVVTSMWAHEEDAGVQMLGCVAISRILDRCANENEVLRTSLSAVAAVVNAMKAHPNEVIVQEKACHALQLMACADGKREVSFVASGAIAAIVGAMQAHVGDAGVQEEACGAVADIVARGGADRATIVASVSGLTAIVNALAAHPNVVGVQKQGCRALEELTQCSKEANLPELPRFQTEPLLEAARTKFPNECEVSALIVLSRLP